MFELATADRGRSAAVSRPMGDITTPKGLHEHANKEEIERTQERLHIERRHTGTLPRCVCGSY